LLVESINHPLRLSVKCILSWGNGLGSSNDFLKPSSSHIDEIAVKINFRESVLSDVGVVEYLNRIGLPETRAFILNGGVGVVAEANYFFNHGDPCLRYLKKHFVQFAILYAAIQTILRFENKIVRIIIDRKSFCQAVANISITK